MGLRMSQALAAGMDDPALGPATVDALLEPVLQAVEARLGVHRDRGELAADADLRHAALALVSPLLLGLLHQRSLGGSGCRPLDLRRSRRIHVARFVRGSVSSQGDVSEQVERTGVCGMLTRLKVDGFKNLRDVDIRFGPLTCVAGPNGVGKSNIFDAISFLAALADKPLMEAVRAVRGGERRGDVASLFRRLGTSTSEEMSFLVNLLVPEEGEDELGQPAKASMTFLPVRARSASVRSAIRTMGVLEIARESMVHINRSDAKANLGFPAQKGLA